MRTLRLLAVVLLIASAWAQDAAAPTPPTNVAADTAQQAPAATEPLLASPEPQPAPSNADTAPMLSGEQSPVSPQDASAPATLVQSPTSPAPASPAPAPSSGPASAQGAGANAQVRVTLDPPEIPFHKQTKFSIIVEAPTDADVKIPAMVDKFGGLSVYGQPDFTSAALNKGRKQLTEVYVLDPIQTGDYRIEPVTVTVNGEAITVASPSVRVRDLTPEEEKEAERFISAANPIDMPLPLWRRWELWAIVALVVAAIGVLTWWLIRTRKRIMRPAPPAPPWEVAYQRLRELDERRLPQAGRTNAYYVELSSILRHYIEDCFNVHAPEQTTPEFLAEASNKHIFSEEQQRMLATFLRHCDRVKFARHEPTIEEMDRSFAEVLRFVDETKPKPQPEKPSEELVA